MKVQMADMGTHRGLDKVAATAGCPAGVLHTEADRKRNCAK